MTTMRVVGENLVPAHPGFPGQLPQSRKTVVVVVVVIFDCEGNIS